MTSPASTQGLTQLISLLAFRLRSRDRSAAFGIGNTAPARPLGLRPPGTLRPLENILSLLTAAGFRPADTARVYRAFQAFLYVVVDSREHIEHALLNFGATDVLFSQRGHLHAIAFKACGRQFRIVLSAPQSDEHPAVHGDPLPSGESAAKTLDLKIRRFWYAFALSTDAKLAAAAAGVATLESEFLAHVVLPGNHTVIDELEPVIASAYRSGQRPSIRDGAPPQFV